MKPFALIALALLGLSPDARSDNCDAIKAQIEAKFRAGGITSPKLEVADGGSVKSTLQGAMPGARVVGTCGNSTRQIVYLGADRPAPAPSTAGINISRAPLAPPAATDAIPTECKDGSIVIGPHCDNPRAVRMSGTELASRVAPSPKASGN